MKTTKRMTSKPKPQPPIKEFKRNGVSVAVWSKQIKNAQGEEFIVYDTKISKSYIDEKIDQWKETNYYTPHELFILHHLINMANTWIHREQYEEENQE